MAPFTIWEKNNNIKKAFKIMKAIDKVGGERRRLLWKGWGEEREKKNWRLRKWDGFQMGRPGAVLAEWGLLLLLG